MPSRIQTRRLQAFQRQHGKCFYCSVAMWLKSPLELGLFAVQSPGIARLRCTAEHLIARSDGGGNNVENIVAACALCNSTRHKRKRPPAPMTYQRQVQARVRRGAWHLKWVFRQGLVVGTPLGLRSHSATDW